MSPRAQAALLWLGAALVSAVGILQSIQPNDEGLMLQAAQRIADGQVPYRDFWWFYPPGQPYLLAALQELTGPSLLTWRVVRVLCDATVALLAWRLAGRLGASPRAALLAWGVAAVAMSTPSGPHPFPPTLVLCLGALLALERRPALAGALLGAAAAWRLEFAGYALIGCVLGLAVRTEGAARRDALLRLVAAATAVGALLYAPVVLRAGLAPSWELLVRYPVLEFGEYQSLPFPLSYDGPRNAASLGGFVSDTLESLALFYVPLVLVLGFAAAVALGVVRRTTLTATHLALGVFAGGMLHYLLARTDEFHTAPLAVTLAVLAAALAGGAVGRAPRVLATVALAAVGYAGVVALDRRVRSATLDTTAIASPVADGVGAGGAPGDGLNPTLERLRAVRPGAPLYVVTRRSDLVTSGYPLLYVLAQRRNPTRYDIPAPGVVTSAPVQREIVADLERERVPVVVRDLSPITAAPEPNRAGRSTGVVLLDRYLAARYRETSRAGRFAVLERRR